MLESVSNFRDVALSVNASTYDSAVKLKPGLLFRSARPDSASETDGKQLRQVLQSGTILDLRSKTEHMEAVRRYREQNSSDPSVKTLTDDQIAQKIRVSGIKYVNVNLNGKGFERHLVWQLGWFDLASLATNMLLGYRVEGIKIIGEKVLQPRGLTGLAIDTLEHSGPEIKDVFKMLCSEDSLPVLIHCTQGKDRTGLVVTLILLLCGVSLERISNDYCLSQRELLAEYDDRMAEIASIGLDDSFARCAPGFVKAVASFIETKYVDIEHYLIHIGISKLELESLRTKLRA